MNRLSIILKNCLNIKYRKDFIEYLGILDFDEFELLFNKYFSIISRFLYIYGNFNFNPFENKSIFLSNKWWKNQRLKNKYYWFLKIFNAGNSTFINEIQNKLIYKIKRSKEITLEIKQAQFELSDIINVELIISNNKENLIRIAIYITKTLIIDNKLKKLSDELKTII